MLGRDRDGLPEPEGVALRNPALGGGALALVDGEDDGDLQPPELVGEELVGRRHPGPPVDHEERGVGLGQRTFRLRHHAPGKGLGRRFLEARRVDGAEPQRDRSWPSPRGGPA